MIIERESYDIIWIEKDILKTLNNKKIGKQVCKTTSLWFLGIIPFYKKTEII